MRFFILILTFLPVTALTQGLSNVNSIDSLVDLIENDHFLTKKVLDTVTYEKEDGGNDWDSAYHHKEYYYKNGEIVKIVEWNKYKNWRNDMVAYYNVGKTINFSKGESSNGNTNDITLDFSIYYFQDKDIAVVWLTPKPANVLGVGTDIFLGWSYSMLKDAK